MYEENDLISKVRDFDSFNQKIIFEGMIYHRGISPTDWELFLDFNGKLFIYGEAKFIGNPITTGQKRALENVSKSHRKAGNYCLAFLFEHNTPNTEHYIYAKDLPVIECCWNGKWSKPGANYTVHGLICKMLEWCKKHKIEI